MEQKITWMQLLFIVLISSIISIAFSCGRGEVNSVVVADYIYVNPTSSAIMIQTYNTGNDFVYNMEAGATLKISEHLNVGIGNNKKIVHSDSVRITFDSNKSINFYHETTSSRNLIKLENYEYTLLSEKHHEFRFVFSESDFD